MPIDQERKTCLETAFQMAGTGNFKNHLELEQALVLSEAGSWHACFTEPGVQQRIDKICLQACSNPNRAKQAVQR